MQILKPSPELDMLKFCEGLTARGGESRRHQFGRLPELRGEPPKLSDGARLMLGVFVTDEDHLIEIAKSKLSTFLAKRIQERAFAENWRIGDRSPCLAVIAVTEYINQAKISDTYCAEMMGIKSGYDFAKTWRKDKLEIAQVWLSNWYDEMINGITG
jgi:hypothetical protein